MKITSSSTRHSAAKKGQTCRLVSSNVVLAMLVVTKSSGAVGGETAPIWLHITITRPICSGSMPYCLLSCTATGAKNSRMESEHTKVPSTNMTAAMMIRDITDI